VQSDTCTTAIDTTSNCAYLAAHCAYALLLLLLYQQGAKSKLERMAKLEAMVEKRKNCFAYLKKTHGGDSYWLNCVLLRRQTDLAIYATELPRQRVLQLFYLGLSLARLLQSSGGAVLVKSVLQVFDFYVMKRTSVRCYLRLLVCCRWCV
jgi:hypothetical protein